MERTTPQKALRHHSTTTTTTSTPRNRSASTTSSSPTKTRRPSASRSPSARHLLNLLSPKKGKDKMSLELSKALRLLGLDSLGALESSFLDTAAFLVPWTDFRDSFLLLQRSGMPVSTVPGQIEGTALLYYYTMYCDGGLRYDELADVASPKYTADQSQYHVVDKSLWTVLEFEKFLYAWLLQSFQVGKSENKQCIEYFEHKNPVTAWRDVFVPIVNAVRQSYDVRGRSHYGRLARFVESVAPSALAFPEGNVNRHVDMMSPMPYRLITMPRKIEEKKEPVKTDSTSGVVLKSQQFDEVDAELREAYPQYGALVERPKRMDRVKTYIDDQRKKKEREKTARLLEGETPSPTPRSVPQSSPGLFSVATTFARRASSTFAAYYDHSTEHLRAVFDSGEPLRVPPGMVQPRSPIGFEANQYVTNTDRESSAKEDNDEPLVKEHNERESSDTVWPTLSISGARPRRQPSILKGDVSSAIRNSGWYDDNIQEAVERPKRISSLPHNVPSSIASGSTANSPMQAIVRPSVQSTTSCSSGGLGTPSAIPKPLFSREMQRGGSQKSSLSRAGSDSRSSRVNKTLPTLTDTHEYEEYGKYPPHRTPQREAHDQHPFQTAPSIKEDNEVCVSPEHRSPRKGSTSRRPSAPYGYDADLEVTPRPRTPHRAFSTRRPGVPPTYEEDVPPVPQIPSRVGKALVQASRIPSPVMLDRERLSFAERVHRPRTPRDEQSQTTFSARVHRPRTPHNEPEESDIRPQVTRIPTTLYSYLDRSNTTTTEPFHLAAPPKGCNRHRNPSPSRSATPPIPEKNPKRSSSVRGMATASHSTAHHMATHSQHSLGARIISKENIRAALGNPSESSSEDEKEKEVARSPTRGRGGLGMQPGELLLRTYNTHQFPSKKPSVNQMGDVPKRNPRYEAGGAYEMGVLRGGVKEEKEDDDDDRAFI